MSMTFTRARRAQARLRLAIVAVSGGGKTMGSLRVAKGMVEQFIDMGVLEGTIEGKIAMIDTERKSASLYSDVCPFDALELEPPYSVDRYMQAVDAAERAGYAVCILDQISHAWAGPGGQLEYVDALKAQSRNAMSPWAKVTPMQQEFYDRILRSPMHIIATMRAKSEWVIDEIMVDGRVKKVPRKIGMSPVQRDGIEYEFTACLDVDLEAHMATASKDRTRLFMGRQTMLDEACGRKLAEWLQTGEAIKLDDPKPEASGDAGAKGKTGAPEKEAADKRAKRLHELESGAEDYKLSFVECGTLPDLAAQYDKAQKFVRGFIADLGAETVQPFMSGVVEAKDTRKAAIQAADQEKTIMIDAKGAVLGEVAGALQPGETTKIGAVEYVVGALSSNSEKASVYYATRKEEPAAGGDLVDQARPPQEADPKAKRSRAAARA